MELSSLGEPVPSIPRWHASQKMTCTTRRYLELYEPLNNVPAQMILFSIFSATAESAHSNSPECACAKFIDIDSLIHKNRSNSRSYMSRKSEQDFSMWTFDLDRAFKKGHQAEGERCLLSKCTRIQMCSPEIFRH